LRLYDYPGEIDRILALAEDGELTPELESQLDSALGALQEKVRSTVAVIRHLRTLGESCKEERERLQARERSLSNQAEALERYLLRCMAHEEVSRVVTDIAAVSRVTNSRPSIRWSWVDREIPEPFRKVKEVVSMDGQAALEAYKAGTLPEGFEVELSEHLRIK
jgi:FtsZ-binding cell division protein ZapB